MRSLRLTRRSEGPRARSRSHRDRSVRMETSIGCTGGSDVLPTCGSSICPGLMSGAVTMKMTSSTSITSIYGTTLISFIRRCLLRRSVNMYQRPASVDLPLQNVGELFHEGIEADRKPVYVYGETVVGNHRGNRGEKAHGSRDQSFGNSRSDMAQRGLRDIGETAEGIHDAPH